MGRVAVGIRNPAKRGAASYRRAFRNSVARLRRLHLFWAALPHPNARSPVGTGLPVRFPKLQEEAHMATVVGMFEHSRDANELVEDLQSEGFTKPQIGVVARHEVLLEHGIDVTTGTEVGAITGATTGGIAGLLIGLGALLVPGVNRSEEHTSELQSP